MHHRALIRLLVLLPTLALPACHDHKKKDDDLVQPASASLNQEYVIGYGETIHLGQLALEFTTLTEESRCPMNAACVWAGNARILVTATGRTGTQILELNTTPGFGSTATFENYRFELRRLEPEIPWYPYPPAQEYTATLFVAPSGT
jgi:hypothetical protein